MKKEIEDKEAFINSFKKKHRSRPKPKSSDFLAEFEPDPDNPFYGKMVIFTGALEEITRNQAMQLIANLGGINGSSVTKQTNYLVLGNNDYCKSIKDGKSAKQKKAEKYKLEGRDIEIISENVFWDMLSE